MCEKKYYQSDKTAQRIDWDNIMLLERSAGGHDNQMRRLLKNITVLGHWNEGDYQGSVATCVQFNDTKEVVIYHDYYGSCSGCDVWEGATDNDVRQMCYQLACGAYVFKNLEDCRIFLNTVTKEEDFAWAGYGDIAHALLHAIDLHGI
jgi:hypothetical protein